MGWGTTHERNLVAYGVAPCIAHSVAQCGAERLVSFRLYVSRVGGSASHINIDLHCFGRFELTDLDLY